MSASASTPSPAPRLAALRAAWPALLLAAAVLLPFLDKAFTIDDSVFLLEARHALADPLHPTSFELAWDGEMRRLSSFLPTGPVMAWLLVPVVTTGAAEWVAHALQLVLLCASIVATASLALRLGLSSLAARAAALLLASAPAVLAMAGTAMPDVPAMALSVLGLERLIAWRDRGSPGAAVAAAVLLALAPLTRTHLVLLLPIAAALLVGQPLSRASWAGLGLRRWLPLVAVPALIALVSLITRDAADVGIGGAAVRLSSTALMASNAVALALHWTFAIPLALPWVATTWREHLRRPWPLLAGTAAAAAVLVLDPGPASGSLALAPVAGLGVAAVWHVLSDAWRRRDGLQLTLGAWLLVPLPAVIYAHLPAKYLVACAPAAALLVGRALGAMTRPRLAVLVATAALGTGLGVAILRADAALAEVGRSGTRAMIGPHVAAGRRVWYSGEWGFLWYAEQAGARPFTLDPPYPEPGDLVATAASTTPFVPEEMPALAHVGRFEDRRPGGRVMCRPCGAGFYSNAWGYLPWAWGDEAVDAVDLWVFSGENGAPPGSTVR